MSHPAAAIRCRMCSPRNPCIPITSTRTLVASLRCVHCPVGSRALVALEEQRFGLLEFGVGAGVIVGAADVEPVPVECVLAGWFVAGEQIEYQFVETARRRGLVCGTPAVRNPVDTHADPVVDGLLLGELDHTALSGGEHPKVDLHLAGVGGHGQRC